MTIAVRNLDCRDADPAYRDLAPVIKFPDDLARAVFTVTAETYGIAIQRLLSRTRAVHVSNARQAAMWALRHAGRSYPRIGRDVGRDAGTVIHAFRQTEVRNYRDPHTNARNMGILEACGIRIGPNRCALFIGFQKGERRGDFLNHERRATDVCCRPLCGKRRREHL